MIEIAVDEFAVDYVVKHDIWNISVRSVGGDYAVISRSWKDGIGVDGPEGFDLDINGRTYNGLEVVEIVILDGSIEVRLDGGDGVRLRGGPPSLPAAISFLAREDGPRVRTERVVIGDN